jgi:hypothetical protein
MKLNYQTEIYTSYLVSLIFRFICKNHNVSAAYIVFKLILISVNFYNSKHWPSKLF